ncbi:restriction endonuclease subunit S [Flavobacterium sp. GSP11]|uniref:restriction endonuclease subunit S n=1 Tax=Flavobacterium sp. GSP11 TaxID=3401730 RepID=UPI003AB10820
MEKVENTPTLRFPEFNGEWESKKLGGIAKFSKGKGISKSDISDEGMNECIRYGELYTRYGEVISDVFSKTNVGLEKSVISEANDVIIPASGETQIDIATASCVMKSGVILGGDLNIIKTKNDGVFLSYYLNSKRKMDIANLAQGISVVHLYSSQLALLNLNLPTLFEQQKIATFLTAVDKKLQVFKQKKILLEQYKKGVMQKIFSQELRFKDDSGNDFEDWKEKMLGEVLFEHKLRSTGNEEVFSVSVHKGLINQIEHLGRSFSAKNTSNYNLVKPFDMVYTKSPTGDFPLGIVKQSKMLKSVIVSPLYGVFTPETEGLGYMLNVFFESPLNTSNYLGSLIQKGAKNTINITNKTFLSKSMILPTSKNEQKKIGAFLSAIDDKINHCQGQIVKTEVWKKGLLQKMFV